MINWMNEQMSEWASKWVSENTSCLFTGNNERVLVRKLLVRLSSTDCLSTTSFSVIWDESVALSGPRFFICYDDWGEVVIAVMFYIFPVDTLVKLTLGFGDVCSKLLPGFTKADASKATTVPWMHPASLVLDNGAGCAAFHLPSTTPCLVRQPVLTGLQVASNYLSQI